jgi:hypothetical protein
MPYGENQRSVHQQSFDRGPSGRRQTDHAHSLPEKVPGPELPTWVEQGDRPAGFGVGPRPARLLAKRAGDACKSKIFRHSRATNQAWHDVVDMECRLLPVLR